VPVALGALELRAEERELGGLGRWDRRDDERDCNLVLAEALESRAIELTTLAIELRFEFGDTSRIGGLRGLRGLHLLAQLELRALALLRRRRQRLELVREPRRLGELLGGRG